MQNIGYNERNAFKGLGTLTFVVYLYFSRVFFTILIGLLIKLTNGKFYRKRLNMLYKFSSKGVFFNQILRISLEAYIEFYLIGMMNLYTVEYKLSGELMAIILTFVVQFMIFAVLPTLSLYVLCKKVEELEEESLKECIGEIYEGIRIKTVFQRSYNLVYISRRFFFLSIVIFFDNKKRGSI